MREKPRRLGTGGAVRRLSVARLPEDHVSGAVFGRLLELDQAAADPVRSEFRRSQFKPDVGLAARFGLLAPAGAELEALPGGIDAVRGRSMATPCSVKA